MKSLSINVPLVESLEQMPGYAKFMKDLMTKKRSVNFETIKVTHQVSAIVHSIAPKLEDPGTFTIPCTIESAEFAKALYDLGANINLMPYSVFKTLGIWQLRHISMRLQMADRTMKRPLGVIEYVLVRIDKFILPVDFVILDCEVDYEVPIIFARCFLATRKALCDVEDGELTFRVGDEKVVFHRMPFGLCNALATFQRCMMAIFMDMVEDYLEVFMDDFSVVRDSFDDYLANLDKVLARCEKTNLVLNWEK
ncbi:uncharacterized protein [Nicotiana tomentosiformis]|uniref:uncharacterized protein n=1 Tax=Nicotiana tomentosiformis TaxID=4098 RepID=UPI00388C375E